MGRTTPDGAGWALGYARSPSSTQNKEVWVWTGVNCHPVDQVDPALLDPYGAFLHDESAVGEPTRAVQRPAA